MASRPRLVSYFREVSQEGVSNKRLSSSNIYELEGTKRQLKFFIRYVPGDFRTLSESERVKIISKTVPNLYDTHDNSSENDLTSDSPDSYSRLSALDPYTYDTNRNISRRESQSPVSDTGFSSRNSHKKTKDIVKEKQKINCTTSKNFKLHWQRQDMLIYLTLCNMPGHVAKRSELLQEVVNLDNKLSKEKNKPLVFTGKTPCNSASACLTMNKDKLFVKIQKPDCRFQYFGLTFPPNNFELAVQKYKNWESQLYKNKFTNYFKETSKNDFPYFNLTSHSKVNSKDGSRPTHGGKGLKTIAKIQSNYFKTPILYEDSDSNTMGSSKFNNLDIPKSWQDLVRVSFDSANEGVFAKRFIPSNTIIGYYFGVPTTEQNFDDNKYNLGEASRFAIMYQFMVLDATDDSGDPFVDPTGPIFCPFHFIKEDTLHSNIAFQEGPEINQIIVTTLTPILPDQELLVSHNLQ